MRDFVCKGLMAFVWLVSGTFCLAAPPTLYSHAQYEGPVRGDPGDLLLLPGYGFSATNVVVYRSVTDTTAPLTPPTGSPAIPATSTSGYAPIVSKRDAANAITVRLPDVMTAGQSYAVWVLDTDTSTYSNGVLINDARPLWVTPQSVYVTAMPGNLPRRMKVVGRNLQPAPGRSTQVRLSGESSGSVYTLTAAVSSSPSLDRYVAEVNLPATLPLDVFDITVSRDGVSWVPLLGDSCAWWCTVPLYVMQDPVTPAASVNVDDYSCTSGDDTSCIVSAIHAAGALVSATHHVANVNFSARTYYVNDPGTWTGNSSSKGVDFEGIWVPQYVNLLGTGVGSTVIMKGPAWCTPVHAPSGTTNPVQSIFNLQGPTTVQGFTFAAAEVYTAATPSGTGALMLGIDPNYENGIGNPNPFVSNITITQNEFKGVFEGIVNGGLPVDHLFVTYNTFGAYLNGIDVARVNNIGLAHLSSGTFGTLNYGSVYWDLYDSVIAYNSFYPSSRYSTGGAGPVASQLGGGTRLDFSNNVADGTSTAYQYSASDRKGFAAAFFWNLGTNSEMKLISQNTIKCSGDKNPDGEAIVFDGADMREYAGFVAAAPVVAGGNYDPTLAWVTTGTQPVTDWHVAPLPIFGQWLQVVKGPGLGQMRKINDYSATGSTATFKVSPGFDVLPTSDSEIVVGEYNWQSYIVDNNVDHSSATCVNDYQNTTTPAAGTLAFYSQTADSVIEGNYQKATTGILSAHQYMLTDPAAPSPQALLMLQSSNEIRNNVIDGPPTFGGVTGRAGVRMAYLAELPPGSSYSATASGPPPVVDFATTIAGNQINSIVNGTGVNTDGGSIDFDDAAHVWSFNSQGACVGSWQLYDSPLVFNNTINNGLGVAINSLTLFTGTGSGCSTKKDSTVWHAVLSGNSCNNITTGVSGLLDYSTASQRVCSGTTAGNSCECSVFVQGNSAATTSASTSITVNLADAQTAGDLNVVAIGWSGSTATISSVTDSAGNTYNLPANSTASGGGASQAIYYAQNIHAAGAGANTLTVSFSVPVTADVRVAEYSGVEATATAFDVATGATGTGLTASSGAMTTVNPNDLVVAAVFSGTPTTGISTDYTERVFSNNLLADKPVTTPGVYSASATQTGSSWWIAQTIAFRMAGTGDLPPTQDLTDPSALFATAVSNAQVNLTWTVATDDAGITGYLIERCTGSSCQNFAQIGTTTGNSFSDTTVAPTTQYLYRVRATDVATLLSRYSGTATVTTPN